MNHKQSSETQSKRPPLDATYDFSLDASLDTLRCHIPLRPSDAARSAANIIKWNSYLPAPCVRTMVRMGWDYTT